MFWIGDEGAVVKGEDVTEWRGEMCDESARSIRWDCLDKIFGRLDGWLDRVERNE